MSSPDHFPGFHQSFIRVFAIFQKCPKTLSLAQDFELCLRNISFSFFATAGSEYGQNIAHQQCRTCSSKRKNRNDLQKQTAHTIQDHPGLVNSKNHTWGLRPDRHPLEAEEPMDSEDLQRTIRTEAHEISQNSASWGAAALIFAIQIGS
jgi:transcription elongation factor